MCEPVSITTAIVAIAGTVHQKQEAKKAEKKATKKADANRKRQEEQEANIRLASKEAKTAKDLKSASDSDRASQQRKARGKKALRSPVPVLGGVTSQPSLGGFGTTPTKPAAPAKPTSFGGL